MKQKLLLSLLTAASLLSVLPATAQNTSPYWSLAGNANASTSSKLGTTNGVSLRFYAGNVQRMVIAYTTGNVGIGTSTLPARFTVQGKGSTPSARWVSSSSTPLFAGFGEGTSGSADFVLAAASGSASVRPVLLGRRSRGTLAAPTIVANNDNLATLLASGYDGAAFQNGASMDFQVDGTPASGKVPTRISFYTGANAGTRTERLRIASNGNVGIGGPTLRPSSARLQIKGDPANENGGGIYVESINDEFRNGIGIGVESRGAIGVKGTGSTGIYGIGSTDGEGGTGVYGRGTGSSGIGVHGDDPDGTGVLATGETGLLAIGSTNEAIRAQGGYFGIVATAEIYGVQGHATATDGYGGLFTSAGTGLYASAGSEPGSYAADFAGNVHASGVFTSSDRNLKQNIQEFAGAMDIIGKLKPRNYEFKTDTKLATLHLPQGKHYGLIAQDVQEVLPNLVAEVHQNLNLATPREIKTNTAIAKQGNSNTKEPSPAKEMLTTKAVNYIELIPIMIKGMQEQQQENDELKARIEKLEALVNQLTNSNGANAVTLLSGSLEQNMPNPAQGTTIIRFRLGEQATSARLELTNAKGQVVKTLFLHKGDGQVALNTNALAAGNYNYTLYVDGKKADTKRLVIAR